MHIILIGPPMCGKTTLGKMLASRLGVNFIDSDELIENAYYLLNKQKLSCREIYTLHGEQLFRELEKNVIISLEPKDPSIIALGGGCLCTELFSHIQTLGLVLYLKAPVDLLWERTNQRGIPAYLAKENPEKSFKELLHLREPLYEKLATTHLDIVNMTQDDILSYLENILNTNGRRNGK